MKTIHTDHDTMLFNQLRIMIDPFLDLFHNTLAKIILAFIWMGGWTFNTGLDLFQTPELLAQGLGWLVFLDWVAGNFRAITDDEIKWKIRKWRRTIVKAGMYGIVCGGVTIAANMFGGAFGYFQIATFAFFAGLEIYSLFRLTGFTAVFWVITELVLSKNPKVNVDVNELRKLVKERARAEYLEHGE